VHPVLLAVLASRQCRKPLKSETNTRSSAMAAVDTDRRILSKWKMRPVFVMSPRLVASIA